MAIVRFNPLNEVVDLQREMNRVFEGFFPSRRMAAGDEEIPSAVWRPVVDIHEDEHGFIIDAELPGLAKEDVKISFQEDTLTVSGERRYLRDNQAQNVEAAAGEESAQNGAAQNGNAFGAKRRGANVHRMERYYGKFIRTFSFPKAVDSDRIKATFENGVLTVTVPKAEATKPRQISIA